MRSHDCPTAPLGRVHFLGRLEEMVFLATPGWAYNMSARALVATAAALGLIPLALWAVAWIAAPASMLPVTTHAFEVLSIVVSMVGMLRSSLISRRKTIESFGLGLLLGASVGASIMAVTLARMG